MSSYKLNYFHDRLINRGEVSRYMFRIAGVPFEDNRIEDDTWKDVKPNTPFGQVPVLEVDDVQFCQSQAIERLLAKRFGLYGGDELEQAKADMVVACGEDLLQAWLRTMTGSEQQQVEKRKKCLEETVPAMLKSLEKMVTSGGFFLGSQMMWCDINIANVLSDFSNKMMAKESFDLNQYPKLSELKKKVDEHPKIVECVNERPKYTPKL